MASGSDGAPSEAMPKLIPVPDALSKPFWDAVNQTRLMSQHSSARDRLRYPPRRLHYATGEPSMRAHPHRQRFLDHAV